MRIRTLSVTEVTVYIKRILSADPILGAVSVRGEVSNFKKHSSGHLYFNLKDENTKIPCVMFHPEAERLTFLPREGQSVLAKGSLSVYERDGRYQLYIRELEPEGVGDLHRQFEELKGKLGALGFFDLDKKKLLPPYPERIAVVTSADGAAWRDIVSVLSRRNPSVVVTLYPAVVQGVQSSPTLCRALKQADQGHHQLVLLARGGGAAEELWAFNDEGLAHTIFSMKTPVITGIGHETDFTIADFVADVRAATPSAAAEIAVPSTETMKKMLMEQLSSIRQGAEQKLQQLHLKLDLNSPKRHRRLLEYSVSKERQGLNSILGKMIFTQQQHLKSLRKEVEHQGLRMERGNPLKVLETGYALLRDPLTGQGIKTIEAVCVGDAITAKLKDGELELQVLGKRGNANEEKR